MGQIKFRYKELADREWLIEQYHRKKLTTTEIAQLIGCTRTGVLNALKRLNISRRTSGESHSAKCRRDGLKSKLYPLLNNERWLVQKYEVEKLSLEDIQKLVGCKNHNSVRQALERFGRPIRNNSEGQTRLREDDGFVLDREIIDGCLLGDGMLKKWDKRSNVSLPVFRKKNKFYDHILWVGSLLFANGPEKRIEEKQGKLREKRFPIFILTSLTHDSLRSFFERWYPAATDYQKVVPHDIDLTPTTLLHWFLDDGSTSWRPDRSNSVRLTFCSESFTEDDNEFLSKSINRRYALRAKVSPTNSGTGWRIKIPESKVADFFDIIGPCPSQVSSMAYKWKLPGKRNA